MTKRKKPNEVIKFPIEFKVEHIDSLGQGVSKDENGGKITFIQKVLPGETGSALVYKSKKNIQFATLTELNVKSENRTEPQCPYYQSCGGCHFLHTSYEQEIIFKRQAFIDNFKRQYKIDLENQLQVHRSQQRSYYRNRIQLHYDKKKSTLGFFNETNEEIVNVKRCIVANDAINHELTKLQISWKSEAPKNNGHVELFQREDEVLKTYDSYYSAQGFLQVNPPMNQKLLELLASYISKWTTEDSLTVDLFGGNGNITKSINHKTYVIDATASKYINLQTPDHQEYHEVDLYGKNAISKIKSLGISDVDLLVLDPPRSGLKNIDEFTQALNPKYIIYVSCNNQTLARDTAKIFSEFELVETHLFDFFPGTRHFESVIFFKHRKRM